MEVNGEGWVEGGEPVESDGDEDVGAEGDAEVVEELEEAAQDAPAVPQPLLPMQRSHKDTVGQLSGD